MFTEKEKLACFTNTWNHKRKQQVKALAKTGSWIREETHYFKDDKKGKWMQKENKAEQVCVSLVFLMASVIKLEAKWVCFLINVCMKVEKGGAKEHDKA